MRALCTEAEGRRAKQSDASYLFIEFHFFLLKICQYEIGIIRVIGKMESKVPKHITTPIGIHSRSPLIIIGSTPSAVVQDVRKIGLILRFPASRAASSME